MIPSDIEADDYGVRRSWAVTPAFYRAPEPGIDGLVAGEYQHAAVEYQIERDNGIIGDAPGVGKSAEAVLLSNAMGARNTLVIPPASLALNWEREIWKWSTIPNVSTYVVRKSSDGVNLEAHYVVVSYDLARNPSILAALMSRSWDHVVLDEAHYLKDPQGNQRTKAICGWMDHGTYVPGVRDVAGRVTLLTGTLMPNQPIECYNAIRMTNHDAIDGASLADFKEFYYDLGEGMIRGFHDVKLPDGRTVRRNEVHFSREVRNQPRNLEDLQHRLRKYVMVRRLKEDVLHELPPKRWMFFPLTVDSAIRKAQAHPGWREVERMYEASPEDFDRSIPIDGEVSTARRLLGEAKAPGVAAYVEDLLRSGRQKVLVSAWHHSVLEILADKLRKYGLVYMDGSTSITAKQKFVDRFQNDDSIRIGLGQMLPLGEGHTLTAAQDGVAAEPWYAPGKNDQFLDRLHRRGQKGSVLGHVPVVPGTLDERILSTAIAKDQHIHAALDKRK